MTIIDSERKRPDPREEVAKAIYESDFEGAPRQDWEYLDALTRATYLEFARVSLSRLNQLGMLNEAYFEAIAEKRK